MAKATLRVLTDVPKLPCYNWGEAMFTTVEGNTGDLNTWIWPEASLMPGKRSTTELHFHSSVFLCVSPSAWFPAKHAKGLNERVSLWISVAASGFALPCVHRYFLRVQNAIRWPFTGTAITHSSRKVWFTPSPALSYNLELLISTYIMWLEMKSTHLWKWDFPRCMTIFTPTKHSNVCSSTLQ